MPDQAQQGRPIDPKARIGHVHLRVADIDRSLEFYCGILGFKVTQRLRTGAVFLSASDYHHDLAINTWGSLGGPPPPQGTTGLFHLAIVYPTRTALATALHRVYEAGVQLDGAADHGVSEALYLRDPDENGVELYWDKPRDQWPRASDGSLEMVNDRLDIDNLLSERAA